MNKFLQPHLLNELAVMVVSDRRLDLIIDIDVSFVAEHSLRSHNNQSNMGIWHVFRQGKSVLPQHDYYCAHLLKFIEFSIVYSGNFRPT